MFPLIRNNQHSFFELNQLFEYIAHTVLFLNFCLLFNIISVNVLFPFNWTCISSHTVKELSISTVASISLICLNFFLILSHPIWLNVGDNK